MASHDIPGSFTCVACGRHGEWPPTIRRGLIFCCGGCGAGGSCICDREPIAGVRIRHCLDVADPVDPAELWQDVSLRRVPG